MTPRKIFNQGILINYDVNLGFLYDSVLPWQPVMSLIPILFAIPLILSWVCVGFLPDDGIKLGCQIMQMGEGNPAFYLFCLQTLDGGDRGRSHGDRQTGATSGFGVSDLWGRTGLLKRPKHGGTQVPHQTARQPRPRLQVLRLLLIYTARSSFGG